MPTPATISAGTFDAAARISERNAAFSPRKAPPDRWLLSAAVGSETVAFDASWGAEPSGLPGPAELLAAALAACLLKNLARTSDLLGFSFEDAEVEVTARRQDRPPRFVEVAYSVRITTDEPERRVELVHTNLRKYGTVVNTLAAACDVHGEVVAVRPTDGLT